MGYLPTLGAYLLASKKPDCEKAWLKEILKSH
jgi:hypothetical protein